MPFSASSEPKTSVQLAGPRAIEIRLVGHKDPVVIRLRIEAEPLRQLLVLSRSPGWRPASPTAMPARSEIRWAAGRVRFRGLLERRACSSDRRQHGVECRKNSIAQALYRGSTAPLLITFALCGQSHATARRRRLDPIAPLSQLNRLCQRSRHSRCGRRSRQRTVCAVTVHSSDLYLSGTSNGIELPCHLTLNAGHRTSCIS